MKMPLFKFPSTIIWVDDSSVFLESIKSASHEFDLFKMKTFSKAPDLLRYLEKNTQNISDEKFLLACKKYEESDLVDHAPTDIDFDKICLSLEGNLQEDEISIVIIDYNMPEMNGIEFCKNVNHLPFNKEGEIRNFVVYNDHTLNEFVSLNSLIDEPNEFMHLIQSKQKIPFFGERVNGWEIETHKWEKYLYPCNVVNGREKYYWCVVDSE